MKIIGNRVLLSRLEETSKDGFSTVAVQDSFVCKGKVEQLGDYLEAIANCPYSVGDIVLFAKYSPDTQEVEVEGKKMKVLSGSDIIAIL